MIKLTLGEKYIWKMIKFLKMGKLEFLRRKIKTMVTEKVYNIIKSRQKMALDTAKMLLSYLWTMININMINNKTDQENKCIKDFLNIKRKSKQRMYKKFIWISLNAVWKNQNLLVKCREYGMKLTTQILLEAKMKTFLLIKHMKNQFYQRKLRLKMYLIKTGIR